MNEPDGQGEGISIPIEHVVQAQDRRLAALGSENVLLQAQAMHLQKQLEEQRRRYTQLLAVCPDDVVKQARAAESPAQG